MGEALSDSKPEKRKDLGAAYAAMGVGLAFVVASVLVGITAGVPAAAFPFLIPAFACLGWGLSQVKQQQHALPKPVNSERELLSAIRDNGGSITPAEAAMETSLTVREADKMLSELAGGGHLAVESRGGALFYSLPGRSGPEIEGR